MMYFSSQFAQANSNVIDYNGNKVYSNDEYALIGKHKVKFTFVSSNSKNEQCIVLALLNFKGDIFWNNKKFIIPKRAFPSLDLFEKDYGKEFILDIDLIENDIGIYNGAIIELGDTRFVRYCFEGCAMMIEELSPTKKRYYCNDY